MCIPLWVECILRWHSPAHHSIQESLPLSSIESKNLKQIVFYDMMFINLKQVSFYDKQKLQSTQNM